METPFTRVLVVEDSEPFRKFICSTIGSRPELQIVGEVTDGLQGVQKAQEVQPDLIVLDIGLPSLNGIEAARRIRKLSPESQILFVSQESSTDVVEEAFAAGARGYIVKTDAGRELLEGIDAVLQGQQFVGRRFAGHNIVGSLDATVSQELRTKSALPPFERNLEIAHRHDVGFYSDDSSLLDDLTQFIGHALGVGSSAVVVATEPHRDSLCLRLQAQGADIAAAIKQGRYIALDAADALPTFMVNGVAHPVRFVKVLSDLIVTAAEAAKEEHPDVAIFGEMCHLLWAQGNGEAAIQVEKLGNQLAKTYRVNILCGYSLRSVHGGIESPIYEKICAEHSAVYSR